MKPALLANPALLAALTLCVVFPVALPAQIFADPANLMGERVKPSDGRELPVDKGARGLQQVLRKLNTRASLMMIVAHPDDEDGGMLTFYSRGVGARVADLSLTRGEGGQNAMTGDFEDALGLLRTQELLASDRYTGVDQFFGTEVDFGFSKTKEEAFSKWTHERVLYDAVRAVRLYRPLVIAAVWVGGVTDGHGQHQVSGQIAQEVFKAAGDPKVFPEMIAEGILPWQPLKVYARVPSQSITPQGLYDYATGQYTPPRFVNYVTGEVSTTTPSADVVVHEGKVDPLLSDDATPRSYIQFARFGLGMQKSQIGPGFRTAPAGTFDVAYHRYGSMLANQPDHEESFFDGIDTSIPGVTSLAPHALPGLAAKLALLNSDLEQLPAVETSEAPAALAPRLAPRLAAALGRLDRILADTEAARAANAEAQLETYNVLHELRIKRRQINEALLLALGVTLDATTHSSDLPVSSAVKLSARLEAHSPAELTVQTLTVVTASGGRSAAPTEERIARPLTSDFAHQQTLTLPAAETESETRPYFSRLDVEEPVYQLSMPELRNSPAGVPALVVNAALKYRGVPLVIERVVHAESQPVAFVAQVSVALDARAKVLTSTAHAVRVGSEIRFAEGTTPKGAIHAAATQGWEVQPPAAALAAGPLALMAQPRGNLVPATVTLTAQLANGSHQAEGFRAVGYGDLPRTNFYTPSSMRVVPVDLQVPAGLRVGYLAGTGDAVPEALASLGVNVVRLTVADLTGSNLKRFDTVVLGVRTYNAHPDLHGAPTQALLDFTRGGGNVVVQYQTAEFTGADAPYPLTLGTNEKVVDETAPVALLDASSPLLRSPNVIRATDFDGWVEERGHGFLTSWDEKYSALTETHDPGAPAEFVRPQEPQRGGLITVQIGKGRWTYCAFALYRQLPEAVPGAFRLFVNLVSR